MFLLGTLDSRIRTRRGTSTIGCSLPSLLRRGPDRNGALCQLPSHMAHTYAKWIYHSPSSSAMKSRAHTRRLLHCPANRTGGTLIATESRSMQCVRVMFAVLVCLLLAQTAGGADKKSQAQATDTKQEVIKFEKAWWEAFKTRDEAALERILADEFLGFDNDAGDPKKK